MPASTLTSKGQITVPKAIRDRLGLIEGDILEFTIGEDGRIIVRPRRSSRGACGVLGDYASDRPVSVDEMKRAVRGRAAKKMQRRSS